MDTSHNQDRRRLLVGIASFLAVSATPSAAILGATSAADKAVRAVSSEEFMRDCLATFERLSPAAQQRFLTYARWLVYDGRAETDPRRNDANWLAYASPRDRRLTS
ncbi:hypothetical protein ACQKLX_07170 [Bosea sp. NPDC003192]|uniref:hypothetical protein n=1 Tax=Bosea sp. NPDC003192 TaxID=3390551 RepID=UPI003D007528